MTGPAVPCDQLVVLSGQIPISCSTRLCGAGNVLPWTNKAGNAVFFYLDCNRGGVMVLDAAANVSYYKGLPPWPTPGWCGIGSASGSSLMLMLTPESNYAAEMVTFGGVNATSTQCVCDLLGSRNTWRLKVDKPTVDNGTRWKWEVSRIYLSQGLVPARGERQVVHLEASSYHASQFVTLTMTDQLLH
jgi:hypothetical protein